MMHYVLVCFLYLVLLKVRLRSHLKRTGPWFTSNRTESRLFWGPWSACLVRQKSGPWSGEVFTHEILVRTKLKSPKVRTKQGWCESDLTRMRKRWQDPQLKGNLASLAISSLVFTFVVACFLNKLPLQVWDVYYTTLL